MAVKWIDHKGKKILYTDLTGLKQNSELIPVLEEALKEFLNAEGRVRHLLNFTGTMLNSEFMSHVKKMGASMPKEKTEKDAYIGIAGPKKILLQAYLWITKDPARVFETIEEALEWLAE